MDHVDSFLLLNKFAKRHYSIYMLLLNIGETLKLFIYYGYRGGGY